MTRSSRLRRSLGFTLVELLVVIGLIAGSTVALVIHGVHVTNEEVTASAESQLQLLTEKLRDAFYAKGDFTLLNTPMAMAMSVFPDGMVDNSSMTVVNPWHGQVTLAPGISPNLADITYQAVPTAACIQLIEDKWTSYSEITVAGLRLKALSSNAPQADLTSASTACGVASVMAMTFTYSNS